MAGLNRVILVGRIGKDPETYSFEDGTKKISFSLATTESYRDKSTGEWKDITDWHNIVGYRYLAERNLAKGDLIYVEGKIKTRKYTDKDGNNRYLTEIVAERFNMLSRYQPSEGNYQSRTQKPAAQETPPPTANPDTSPATANPDTSSVTANPDTSSVTAEPDTSSVTAEPETSSATTEPEDDLPF